jgi:hypothetical protein
MLGTRKIQQDRCSLKKIFSDPLVRRFFSAAFFASAFVWVAVEFFDVEVEVIKVLFIYSVGFILLMVLIGFVLFPFMALFRKKRSSLLEDATADLPEEVVEEKKKAIDSD